MLVDGRRINSCLTLAVMHQGQKVTTIEGLGTPTKMHPMQAAFVKHDGFQCGYCTPGQICSAVAVLAEIKQGIPSHASTDLNAEVAADAERNPRAHERQHLPVRRVLEHCRRHHRSGAEHGQGEHMKPFSYERAATPAAAAAAAARNPDAKFIAGGTNLLDLMKLEIEKPAHLIDVNGLALDKIETTPDGGMRIGALVRNTDLAADARVGANTRCCRAPCWPALPANCATGPPRRATCCNARAARISTIRTRPATSATPAAAARHCKDSAASSRWSVRAMPVSRPTLPTWRSRCARSMRRSKRCGRTARRGKFPSRTFTRCPVTRHTSRTRSSVAS